MFVSNDNYEVTYVNPLNRDYHNVKLSSRGHIICHYFSFVFIWLNCSLLVPSNSTYTFPSFAKKICRLHQKEHVVLSSDKTKQPNQLTHHPHSHQACLMSVFLPANPFCGHVGIL